MSDPAKSSKAPPLLLMGSLERVSLDQSASSGNFMMPIPQAQESVPFSSDGGEEDSFVGQTSGPHLYTSMTDSEPFANLQQLNTSSDGSAPFMPGFTTGSQTVSESTITPLMGRMSVGPQPPINRPPPSSSSRPSVAPPPRMGEAGPSMRYQRPSGKHYTYVQAPGSTAASQGFLGPAANLPPQQLHYPSGLTNDPSLGGPQLPAAPPKMSVRGSAPSMVGPPPVGYYQMPFQGETVMMDSDTRLSHGPDSMVIYHWCYRETKEPKEIWQPFSRKDSAMLEQSYVAGDGSTVRTDGGRFDVNVDERLRYPVYWDGTPVTVRRASWFFKPEGDSRFVPFEEDFSVLLESEYQKTIASGQFHRRLEFRGGEVFIIHNPHVIVQYTPTAQPDEWGLTGTEQSRPRVVKRGTAEVFQTLAAGESDTVDHLVLVIHGIGSTCDLRFRNIVECVEDLRRVSLQLTQSHFGQAHGRVEFLPVRWHSALHGDATGVDQQLRTISLPSISKLRHFTNDTLLDILFYSSPVYSQTILDTVAGEMNRLYGLFQTRNPSFSGGVSVVGHSLGSLVLFDLLSHQQMSSDGLMEAKRPGESEGQQQGLSLDANPDHTTANSSPPSETFEMISHVSSDEEAEDELEQTLAKLGISGLQDIFTKEQVDHDTLVLLDETDLKEMGIPLGPRKKLLGFIKEYRNRKDNKKEKLPQESSVQQVQKTVVSEVPAEPKLADDPVLRQTSETQFPFLLGCGARGVGVPYRRFPPLNFSPENFFALGAPVSMFLTVRGVDTLGDDFHFPSCPGFFNIFHPFDPVAYRMEPLLVPSCPPRPVLMPHHKGRKRIHLELKDSLSRMGADLKQKLMESVRSTWKSISQFAAAHRGLNPEGAVHQDPGMEQVETMTSQMLAAAAAADDTESITSSALEEDDLLVSGLNQGRRVDYVLQEGPLESFNEYLFALGSHACYWDSEDTMLLMMKEIYQTLGVQATFPGREIVKPAPLIGGQFSPSNTQV